MAIQRRNADSAHDRGFVVLRKDAPTPAIPGRGRNNPSGIKLEAHSDWLSVREALSE